jgi:Protein of unknown function (DUF3352)
MTATRTRYLVRRVIASMVVSLVIGLGLVRAFAMGGTAAPPDRAAAFVPRGALVYLNLANDQGSAQWKRGVAALDKLPTLGGLRSTLLGIAQGQGALAKLDYKPWLGNEAAMAVLPDGSKRVLVLKAKDVRKARQAIDLIPSPGVQSYHGVQLRDVGHGELAGIERGFVLAGDGAAVRAAIDAAAGGTSLASDKTYAELRKGLPHERLVTGYLSEGWIKSHLGTPAALISAAAHVPSLQATAISMGATDKRLELTLRSRPAPGASTACGGNGGDQSGLIDKAPARPAAFVSLSGLRCLLGDAMASPTSGIGKALRNFAVAAQGAGVNVGTELLPLLSGQSGVSLVPGTDGPGITLDVAGVPAGKGMDVIGRLQPAIINLLSGGNPDDTPDISTNGVNGVNVLTTSLASGLKLNYAAFGGDLLVSTDPNGIATARKGAHLGDSSDFKTLLGDRPKSTSALVFFDLQKLLALADQAGLSSNPTYSAVRDDLQKIGAAGIVLARKGKDIDAELRLKLP